GGGSEQVCQAACGKPDFPGQLRRRQRPIQVRGNERLDVEDSLVDRLGFRRLLAEGTGAKRCSRGRCAATLGLLRGTQDGWRGRPGLQASAGERPQTAGLPLGAFGLDVEHGRRSGAAVRMADIGRDDKPRRRQPIRRLALILKIAFQPQSDLRRMVPVRRRVKSCRQHQQAMRPQVETEFRDGHDQPVYSSGRRPCGGKLPHMKIFFRYGTFPLLLFGANAAIVALLGAGAPYWQPFAVLGSAVGFMFTAEWVIPYVSDWNADHEDAWTNALHAVANTVLSHAGVFALPWLAAAAPFKALWPSAWPFWLQVVVSILVLDLGISAAHHASHRWNWLWRFHAVHHSARRLYGLNGLMKHPVHQMIETLSGVGPLWLLGIPQPVAAALAFCVAIQLLLQHANA